MTSNELSAALGPTTVGAGGLVIQPPRHAIATAKNTAIAAIAAAHGLLVTMVNLNPSCRAVPCKRCMMTKTPLYGKRGTAPLRALRTWDSRNSA